MPKLTDEQRARIRASSEPTAILTERYAITASTVWRVRHEHEGTPRRRRITAGAKQQQPAPEHHRPAC
jgi:hypothetical protein